IRLDRQAGVQLEECIPECVEVLDAESLAEQRDVAAASEIAVGVTVAWFLGLIDEVRPRKVDKLHFAADSVRRLQRLPFRRMLTERVVSAARCLSVGGAEETVDCDGQAVREPQFAEPTIEV